MLLLSSVQLRLVLRFLLGILEPHPLTLSIGGAQVSCSHREGNSSFGGRKEKFIVAGFKGHGHRAGAAGLASNAIGELWDEEEVSLPCGGMIGSDIFRPDDQRLSKLLEMMAWIFKPSIQEPLLLHHHQHQQQ